MVSAYWKQILLDCNLQLKKFSNRFKNFTIRSEIKFYYIIVVSDILNDQAKFERSEGMQYKDGKNRWGIWNFV
jgi:hypothetical protein